MVGGDLNQLDTASICAHLNLINMVSQATRGNNILDYILKSKNVSRTDYCSAATMPPLQCAKNLSGKESDHNCVFLRSPIVKNNSVTFHKVFDYRSTNINSFCDVLHSIDFTPMYQMTNIDHKVIFFNNALKLASSVIPYE